MSGSCQARLSCVHAGLRRPILSSVCSDSSFIRAGRVNSMLLKAHRSGGGDE
jgi:hypothetical protein